MRLTLYAATLAAAALLSLAACGGGGGSPPATEPPAEEPEPEPEGEITHIGPDIAPERDASWRHDGTVQGIDMFRAREEPYTLHIFGTFSVPGGEAGFGVTTDLAGDRAWAYGPTPETPLVENHTLSGTATWQGVMAGQQVPLGDIIGADVDLSIELETLIGELDFTDMRYMSSLVDPVIAVGDPWGDGDLNYLIVVRGNAFIQVSGDAGSVTGAFFGTGHEGMGGSLERSDLTAAFGGKR